MFEANILIFEGVFAVVILFFLVYSMLAQIKKDKADRAKAWEALGKAPKT